MAPLDVFQALASLGVTLSVRHAPEGKTLVIEDPRRVVGDDLWLAAQEVADDLIALYHEWEGSARVFPTSLWSAGDQVYLVDRSPLPTDAPKMYRIEPFRKKVREKEEDPRGYRLVRI